MLVSRIEIALEYLFYWFCDHGMKVNASKTEFIVFGSKPLLRVTSEVSVRFADSVINASKEVRNL